MSQITVNLPDGSQRSLDDGSTTADLAASIGRGLAKAALAATVDGHEQDLNEALAVNVDEWKAEVPTIEEWYEFVGDRLPAGLQSELDALVTRLDEADKA